MRSLVGGGMPPPSTAHGKQKGERGVFLEAPFLHAQGSNFSKAELNYKNILQPHTAILPTKKESLTLTGI
jgi:hypothetical protein